MALQSTPRGVVQAYLGSGSGWFATWT